MDVPQADDSYEAADFLDESSRILHGEEDISDACHDRLRFEYEQWKRIPHLRSLLHLPKLMYFRIGVCFNIINDLKTIIIMKEKRRAIPVRHIA